MILLGIAIMLAAIAPSAKADAITDIKDRLPETISLGAGEITRTNYVLFGCAALIIAGAIIAIWARAAGIILIAAGLAILLGLALIKYA